MSVVKAPAWLEDSVKFVTYTSVLFGAIATGIAYLFGKDKGLLTVLFSALFIAAIVVYRILSRATAKWTETIGILEGPQTTMPNAEKKKELAAELRKSRRNVLILSSCSVASVITLAGVLAYEHWPQRDLTRRPEKLPYVTCKLINPADHQDVFQQWPFLEPVKVQLLREVKGRPTGVLFAVTEEMSHPTPAFVAGMTIANAKYDVVYYAFLKSMEDRLKALQVDYPGDGRVKVHVPGMAVGDSLLFFGRVSSVENKLPQDLSDELKLSIE